MSLEYNTFRESSITDIIIPDNVVQCQGQNTFYQAYYLEKVSGGNNLLNIGNNLFYECISLKGLSFSKVKTISTQALVRLDEITFINLPSVESIEGYNIHTCPNLIELNLGDKLKILGKNFLEFCVSLKHVIFPETLTDIGSDSIYGNNSMEYIIFLSEIPPTLGNTNIFKGQSYNYPIYVPDGSLYAYKNAAIWNSHASRIRPISELVE